MLKVNRKHLENVVSELEKGYVDSLVALIKVPIFNKRINADLKKEKDPEKKKQLENAKKNNELQAIGHKESLENLEVIIPQVKNLLPKRFRLW